MKRIKKLTVKKIMRWEPCHTYPEKRVRSIIGQGKTIKEFAKLDYSLFDSCNDITWVLFRQDIFTENQLHRIAVYAAKQVLPIYENYYQNDKRPRKAIKAKEKWLKYIISDRELNAARAAAGAAAWDAARAAAGAVTWAAARETVYKKIIKYAIRIYE